MTIASIVKGDDFAGLLRYLFGSHDSNGDRRPEVVYFGGSVPGRNSAEIAEAMGRIAAQRPRVTKPVRHWMLAFAPEDMATLDHARMSEIAERFTRQMGADAYVSFSHGDHVHIVANAVTLAGAYVSDRWDYARAQTIVRELEIEYGLRRLVSTHEVEDTPEGPKVRTVKAPDERRPSKGELNAAAGGQPSIRLQLQEIVRAAAEGGPTLSEFIARLEAFDVHPLPRINKSGWYGVSYEYQGLAFKGEDLGDNFKAKALQRAGVTYEQDRDREACERCRRRAEGRGADADPRRGAAAVADGRGPVDAAGRVQDRDTGAASPGDRTPGSESSGSRGPAESIRAGSDPSDRDHGREGGRERPEDGRDAEADPRPGAGPGARAGGTASPSERPPGERDGDGTTGEQAADEPDRLDSAERQFARGGAYARVISLAGFAPPPRSSGGRGDSPSVRERQRAGLRALAVGKGAEVAAEAVRRQLEAMGSEAFEVGVLPPKDRPALTPQQTRTLTADEIASPRWMAFLRAMNARGYEIYIRPEGRTEQISDGLILLDDLDRDRLDALSRSGYEASVITETSPGNYQAWVRVSDEKLSAREATAVARELARQHGGDPASADFAHYGRLAGFANRKSHHADAQGRGPWVRLHHAARQLATKGADLLRAIRAALAAEDRAAAEARAEQERQRRAEADRAARMTAADRARLDPIDAFRLFRAEARTAKEADESARDFGAVVRMIRAGYDPDDIARALRTSPDLEARKGRHVDDYIARTIARAAEQERGQAYRPR